MSPYSVHDSVLVGSTVQKSPNERKSLWKWQMRPSRATVIGNALHEDLVCFSVARFSHALGRGAVCVYVRLAAGPAAHCSPLPTWHLPSMRHSTFLPSTSMQCCTIVYTQQHPSNEQATDAAITPLSCTCACSTNDKDTVSPPDAAQQHTTQTTPRPHP